MHLAVQPYAKDAIGALRIFQVTPLPFISEGVFHVALRRPEMMKRECDKVGTDEGRREVVS